MISSADLHRNLTELSKRIDNLAIEPKKTAKSLGFSIEPNKVITGVESVIDRYSFIAERDSVVSLEYAVCIDSPNSTAAEFLINLNGKSVGTVSVNIPIGVSEHILKINLTNLLNGENRLECLFAPDSTTVSRVVKKVRLHLSGEYIFKQSGISTVKVCRFCANDIIVSAEQEKLIYYSSPVDAISCSEHSIKRSKPVAFNIETLNCYAQLSNGSFTSSQKLIFFKIDYFSNLYYCEFDIDSGEIGVYQFIDRNVSCFSVAQCSMPWGIMISYVNDKGCYTRLIKAEGNKLILLAPKLVFTETNVSRIDIIKQTTGYQFIITRTNRTCELVILHYEYDDIYPSMHNFSLLLEVDNSV